MGPLGTLDRTRTSAFGRARWLSRLRRGLRAKLRRSQPTRLAPVSARLAQPIQPLAPTGPRGPKLVLLNDCRDQINFGANALVDGLIRIMQDSAPTAAIHPVPSHWLLDPSLGMSAFVDGGRGMEQPQALYPSVADQFEDVAAAWLRGDGGPGAHHILECFQSADLVVLNAEGSVYRTNLSAIRELFLAWLSKCRLGIPTVFVNGTVHLTDVLPILPAMARKTLAALDEVAVREPCSVRNLQQYAPDVRVQLLPDTAFVFTADEARESPISDVIRRRVGGRPYFCFDPGPMPIDARPGRASALYRLIVALKEVTPEVIFIRNNPGDSYIQRIAQETDSLYIDSVVHYGDWMGIVQDAQFLVSGRYHNTILASIMGCPTITLASASHKVHGVCEMLDTLVGTPYDGTDLLTTIPSIVAHARHYTEHRTDLAEQLRDVCARRRSETAGIGALITRALASSGSPEPHQLSATTLS